MTTRKERTMFLRSLPWVKELDDESIKCSGYRWGKMPTKAIRKGKIDREKYRCKLRGRWRFTALASDGIHYAATSGDYCWHHLLGEINGCHNEEKRIDARWDRWVKRKSLIRV